VVFCQDILDDIAKMLYIDFMKTWTVEFMNQTVEAEFESLPAEVRAKTLHIANLIREFGLPNIGMPYIKHVQDKIWELRALQGRSLYITTTGEKIIIAQVFHQKIKQNATQGIENCSEESRGDKKWVKTS
jgi:phage-related protein